MPVDVSSHSKVTSSDTMATMSVERSILLKNIRRIKQRSKELRDERDSLQAMLSKVQAERDAIDESLMIARGYHERDVDVLSEETTCAVCTDIVNKPCVISPCGHIFCECCLLKWFQRSRERLRASTPLLAHEIQRQVRQRLAQRLNAIDPELRYYADDDDDDVPSTYQCPTCRGDIDTRPTRCPAIQNIVGDILLRTRTYVLPVDQAVDEDGVVLSMGDFFL